MKRLLTLIFLALLTSPLHAATINHTFVQQNTNQTTTNTAETQISGMAVADTFFSTGKKYLIYATAQATTANSGFRTELRVRHGGTNFGESQSTLRVNTNERVAYAFCTVWTAVASENIDMTFHAQSSSTAHVDFVSLFVMNLSDNLTENTDWFFNERADDDALSTTPVDGASITFTPSTAGHDWLILPCVNINTGAQNTSSVISRLVRSGEAASSTPEWRLESPSASGNIYSVAMPRVFNLGAASNTFKEQSEGTATAGTRRHSAIFALNLNKFAQRASAYTEGTTTVSTTAYATELQTISITPGTTGNVWIGSYYTFDKGGGSNNQKFRLQIGNSDQPAGQTTANYIFFPGTDSADKYPLALSTLTELTASAHTIDLDASRNDGGGSPVAKERSLFAVTMELATTKKSRARSQTIFVD